MIKDDHYSLLLKLALSDGSASPIVSSLLLVSISRASSSVRVSWEYCWLSQAAWSLAHRTMSRIEYLVVVAVGGPNGLPLRRSAALIAALGHQPRSAQEVVFQRRVDALHCRLVRSNRYFVQYTTISLPAWTGETCPSRVRAVSGKREKFKTENGLVSRGTGRVSVETQAG